MTKNLKIWMGIFMGMFLVPAVLMIAGVRGVIAPSWRQIASFENFKNIFLSVFESAVPLIALIGLTVIVAKLTMPKKIKVLSLMLLASLMMMFGLLTFVVTLAMIAAF